MALADTGFCRYLPPIVSISTQQDKKNFRLIIIVATFLWHGAPVPSVVGYFLTLSFHLGRFLIASILSLLPEVPIGLCFDEFASASGSQYLLRPKNGFRTHKTLAGASKSRCSSRTYTLRGSPLVAATGRGVRGPAWILRPESQRRAP